MLRRYRARKIVNNFGKKIWMCIFFCLPSKILICESFTVCFKYLTVPWGWRYKDKYVRRPYPQKIILKHRKALLFIDCWAMLNSHISQHYKTYPSIPVSRLYVSTKPNTNQRNKCCNKIFQIYLKTKEELIPCLAQSITKAFECWHSK